MVTGYWMRSPVPHTPAHDVESWDADTRQVQTRCGWRPAPGGELVGDAEVMELEAYRCVLCARSGGAR